MTEILLISALSCSLFQFVIILLALAVTDRRPFNVKNLGRLVKLVFSKPVSFVFLLPLIGLILLLWEGAKGDAR